MVTFERDMQQMRELLAAVAHEIGIETLPPLGAMIETPAAALTVSQIAKRADFLSVGTNDLTQYTLVAGRDNATVRDYHEDTHSSMLRLLGIIIAEASGKPVTICGEMAGREEVIPTAPVRRRIRESLPLGCRGRQLFYQVAHEIGIETLAPLGAMIETPQCRG
jgi:phosphoenolpyruvate-protein kinase (PTS system EI component)